MKGGVKLMTRNQIEYWANKEKERSNRANESETFRANYAREQETHRSNLANEVETNRHNVATESLQQYANMINKIRNDQSYQLGLKTAAETERSNKAREKENTRSAKAREQETINQRLQDYAVKKRQMSQADYSNYTARLQAEETQRSHRANEVYNLSSLAELSRSNVANETERNRANVVSEAQKYAEQAIRRQELGETIRTHQMNEQLTARGQTLNFVSNLANAGSRFISSSKGIRKGVIR